MRGAPLDTHTTGPHVPYCGIARDPCQALAHWRFGELERKRSVLRDYGVPNQGFGRYFIKALQQDQGLDLPFS
jgi:hypothetical protein